MLDNAIDDLSLDMEFAYDLPACNGKSITVGLGV